MQQEGVNTQSLGLSAETIDLFEKYDNFFEDFEENGLSGLSEEEVLNMADEIEQMHFRTVKEKMGSLIGEDPENIKMYYSFENSDGKYHTSIIANEDSYKREVYSNNRNLILPNDNCIPVELSDIILQLQDFESLTEDIRNDSISKVNAVKKLQKLYTALEQVATGEFMQDERGNISIIHYESKELENEQERD